MGKRATGHSPWTKEREAVNIGGWWVNSEKKLTGGKSFFLRRKIMS